MKEGEREAYIALLKLEVYVRHVAFLWKYTFYFHWPGRDLRFCISNKLSGDDDAAGLWTHYE